MPDWSSVKGIIGKIAPMVAGALGTPLAGAGVAVLCNALGLTSDSAGDPNAVQAAIAGATPDQLLAIKKADEDFQVQMAQLGYKNAADLAALVIDDRKDARAMQIATKSLTAPLLAAFITLGFFGVLSYILVYTVPATSRDIVNILLGSLGTAWINVIAYYFGSSAGSDKKSDLLANSVPAVNQ